MQADIYVSFRLNGEYMSPEEITQELGVTPDETRVAGGPFKRRPELKRPNSSWILNSSLDMKRRIYEHISNILDRLDGKQEQIKRYVAAEDIFCNIFCSVYPSEDEDEPIDSGRLLVPNGKYFVLPAIGLDIPSRLMRRLAEFDLDVMVDFYPTWGDVM